MKCYLCKSNSFLERSQQVRDANNLKVIECENCGLVTLNDFSHIEEKHYEDGKMHLHQNTIEEWMKETEVDDQRRIDMLKSKMLGKKVLDFGCGNGGFLIKSNKFTQLSEGIELEKRVQEYFKKKETKIWNSLDDAINNSNEKYDLITAFHVFEHLSDPIKTLKSLTALLNLEGEIIIEVPSSDDALLTLFHNEAFGKFTYWSQHLFLFNQHTILDLVKKANLKLNWVKQIQRYGLSNHLFWLSNHLPGGHKKWSFFNSTLLDELYAEQLASIGKCDTILASISVH
jgi:2-polyprenyl-3-methyl-5-hydroxy-6-metoxy-1,4-benzoquinol methylase